MGKKSLPKSLLKRLWGDPVWSIVIASAIVAGVSWGTGWWRLLPAAGKALRGWLVRATPIPNWVFCGLALLALAVAWLLWKFIIFWTGCIADQARREGWRSYVTDHFLGLRWRWRYGEDGSIEVLHPFCPSCDYQIFPRRSGTYTAVPRVAYPCDSCGRVVQEFDGTPDEVVSQVARLIHVKLRSGKWPTHEGERDA